LIMLGSHLSVSGGLVNALHEAKRLKMDCVQIFTANQRQWNPKPPTDEQTATWLAELKAMHWDSFARHAPNRVVSHNSYLINMASPDAAVWAKSVAAMRAEIERCEHLHVPLVVAHPGAHLGTPRRRDAKNDLSGVLNNDERQGIERIVKAIDQIHRALPGYRTITCLETTVGAGTHLGYSFHHLALIRIAVREPERIGYCVDTCHITAAGYDLTTPAKAAAVLEEFDRVCGLREIRCFHFNDSEGTVGSRVDRHAHIGDGQCGRACFAAILNHRAFTLVPKILETEKGNDDRGRPWDVVNIQRLRRMMAQKDPARVSAGRSRRRATVDR
jgi:deoxyribonuclease-4